MLTPDDLVDKYCERWKKYGGTPAEVTSANMTDVAMHRLYLAVVTEDAGMLHESLHYVFEPVAYTTGKEGFQYDNSYTYHRRQFYIGGYSEVVLTNVLTVACWVAGTEFAMEEDKVDLLSKFVRGTFADVIRGRVMFFNALGRSVSREDYLYKTEERTEFMRQMAVIDPQYASEYAAISARLKGDAPASYMIEPQNINYYIADYALHQRPGWSAGIRTVSERTVRQEVFAGNENLFGYFLSDGSTAIGTTGEEYGNIMPLWDWNHIPGVTAPVLAEIPIPAKYVSGTSSFTGGVSDGIYGVMTYSYQDTLTVVDTGAQKGWFALDEELVCLGSAINSPYQVHTTVDQNWGGSFEICTTGGRRYSSNDNGDDIAFVVNNDIGYYFPQGGHVCVEKNRKYGSWYNINVNQSERTIDGDVFKLYLDHKIPNMEQDKWSREYCYVVCPGKNGGQMSDYVQNRQLFIHNTDSVQCVVDSDKDVAQFIFYEPCGFSHNGIDVKVSKPCVLMVRDYQKSNMRVYLADVLRDSVPFSVEIKTPNSDTQKIEVALSLIEGYKGETKEYVLVNNRE